MLRNFCVAPAAKIMKYIAYYGLGIIHYQPISYPWRTKFLFGWAVVVCWCGKGLKALLTFLVCVFGGENAKCACKRRDGKRVGGLICSYFFHY